jgi:uncharacterized membrane protein YhaH (DUF805 family)
MSFYFSATGRISRHQWWLGVIGVVVYSVVGGFTLGWILGQQLLLAAGGRIILFLFQLIGLYAYYCVTAKRFQDRERPVLYAQIVVGIQLAKALLDLVGISGDPFHASFIDYLFLAVFFGIGIWLVIELGFLRGTIGPNQYGADPVPG